MFQVIFVIFQATSKSGFIFAIFQIRHTIIPGFNMISHHIEAIFFIKLCNFRLKLNKSNGWGHGQFASRLEEISEQ